MESHAGRPWWQRLVLAAGVTICLVSLAGVGAVGYSWWQLDHITKYKVELSPGSDGVENYLVVGSDSRASVAADDPNKDVLQGDASDGQRSDTIMVIRVDSVTQSIEALSIPRDLYVELPNGRHDRINVAYSLGRQALIDTIRSALGIEIHHYLEFDFSGFKNIVAAVGGVPLWFDAPMRDLSSGLDVASPGCQLLDGDQALAFARARHAEFFDGATWKTDPTGDLGRITRQQLFIRRIADRASAKGLTDPRKAKRLIDSATDYLGVDDALTTDGLLQLVARFRNWTGDELATYTLPIYPFTAAGGAAVVGLYEVEAQPTLNHFRGRPEGELEPALVRVDVVNRSGKSVLTSQVKDAFTVLGFTTRSAKAETTRATRTEIDYGPGARAAAELLERHLTAGAKLVSDGKLSHDTVRLIVGSDFTTVSTTPRAETASVPSVATRAAGSPAPPPTEAPTTSVIGRAIGLPPDGVDCG